VFGPAAQAAIDAYETGNYQSLGSKPDENGGSDAVLDLMIINGFNDVLYQDSVSSYHVIRYNH
jgi:hypothetical protein